MKATKDKRTHLKIQIADLSKRVKDLKIEAKQLREEMKSDLAKARDEWLKSSIGEQCCKGSPSGQYLQHRLEAAFIAGWGAYEKAQREVQENRSPT